LYQNSFAESGPSFMTGSSIYPTAALGSLQGTEVTEKNHYHPMNWIKKQKRGNCDIIQDVSPISEARACNIVPLEIV
jgi:hypothetical protein